MAALTAKKRAKIPKQKFALPGQRAYPVHDAKHARNAKARASQALRQGKISQAEFNKVVKAANKTLGAGTAKAAKKKGLATAGEIRKKAGRFPKKVESVAARKGTKTVVKGRTVTKRKGSKQK